MARLATADLLDLVLDDGTWRSWDVPTTDPTTTPEYAAELSAARAATGVDESVTCGSAQLAGHPVAVVAGNFDFLAGSIGQAAAERIMAAFERATALGLPMLGLPTSGGTRMQEGTPAFLQMAGIAAAVRTHTDAGLPYLVYLRHPTTGGVFATWGSLGDVTVGEPGALTGFLGPRVYEGLFGRPFEPDVQHPENLAAAGVMDGTAPATDWRDLAARVLTVWRARPDTAAGPPGWEQPNPEVSTEPTARAPDAEPAHLPAGRDAWDAIQRTRQPQRSGVVPLIERLDTVVELSGTTAGESASVTRLWLAAVDGIGCVIVGQDRDRQASHRHADPAAGLTGADLRVARRGMQLAQRWALPLVTVIDTQGAELSPAAELGALAGEIARCLSDLSVLGTPTLSILLGGGGGGGALALLPADRTLAAADAWLTPLPAEGASLIRFRTAERAPELAEAQAIRAADLQQAGAVGRIVEAPVADVAAWRDVLSEELSRLVARGPGPLPRRWPAPPG